MLQPDGKLVAGGGADYGFAIVRYNADGGLDVTFGPGGIVRTYKSNVIGSVKALLLEPDGKLLVAGNRESVQSGTYELLRYSSDGTVIDRAFEHDQRLDVHFAEFTAVIELPDGKVIVAGSPGGLVGYNPDGSLGAR